MSYVSCVVLILIITRACHAECPHEESGLAKFSETYTGNLENTEIDITGNVLLDVPNLSVKRLIISGNGKLVFGRGIDITLRAKAILVKDNGQFIIGSEDCRHTDIVNIILQGKKGEFPELKGPGGEEKYIIVQDQGVLKIHGADKLSWTKINATLDRWEAFSDDPTMIIYQHTTSDNAGIRHARKGLAVYRIDEDFTVADYDVVDLHNRNRVTQVQKDVDAFITTLDNIPTGQLVSIALQNYFLPVIDLTALYNKIEDVAGMQRDELYLRDAGKFTAFTLMFIEGGQFTQSLEQLSSTGISTAQSSLELGNYKVTSISHIEKDKVPRSYIDLLLIQKSIPSGYPTATTVNDISSWNVVPKVPSLAKQAISLNTEQLMYRHFGEIENRVDMRAEIALLTRNIKIQGEVQDGCPVENGNCEKVDFDSFGGQVKMDKSFGEVHIQGVEFIHMGQLGVEGAYPIHFHMCQDISGKTALIENNSIHHTFQRAVTIHGTWGLSLEQPGAVLRNNVAYYVFGHTFFLEDGVESGTIFIGNLGALTMNIETGFFATDANAATTFWITNPEVVLIGNVAAGSTGGSGFWYVFPVEPVGQSAGLRYQKGQALKTPIWTCDNNIAHSNDKSGFEMSKTLLDDEGNVGLQFKYVPRVGETSELAKVQVVRLTGANALFRTISSASDFYRGVKRRCVGMCLLGVLFYSAYKNRQRNAWIQGGAQLMQYSSAESNIGIAMARASSEQQQFASKLILVGVSEKNGEQEGYPDAYTPKQAEYHPGIELIYGPQYYSHVWFTGYQSNSGGSYAAGGIGFKRESTFHISELTSFRDFRYGFNDPTKVDIKNVWTGTKGDYNRSVIAQRVKYSDQSDTAYENHLAMSSTPRLLMILGNQAYYYTVEFIHQFPKDMTIEVDGVERDNNVVVGVCLPEGAVLNTDFELKGFVGSNRIETSEFKVGSSLSEVGADPSMQTVYTDGRILYLHFATDSQRDLVYDTARCFDGLCPKYVIEMSEQLPYTPCFNPTPEKLSTDFMPELVPELTCEYLPTTYGVDWGVGDTFASHNGAWSEWSTWSSCESSSRTRTRLCDSPPPYGDGAECGDATYETESC